MSPDPESGSVAVDENVIVVNISTLVGVETELNKGLVFTTTHNGYESPQLETSPALSVARHVAAMALPTGWLTAAIVLVNGAPFAAAGGVIPSFA